MLLPGVGQGFFNDQNPAALLGGNRPGVRPSSATSTASTDLVTVNAGSNDLTLISGFEARTP